MAWPKTRSLPLALCAVATALGASGTAAAAPIPLSAAAVWHVAVNGTAIGGPSPLVGGRVFVPVGALAKAMGDVVVSAGSGAIALTARAGPPEAYLASPASVLLTSADLGPGYQQAEPTPAQTPAYEPTATGRLADGSITYTILPEKKLKGLPVSVYYGPAEIAVTAAEYASAATAAAALGAAVTALDAPSARWPGVSGALTPLTSTPGPLGDASAVWSASNNQIQLVAMRINNWVVTSAVGGTTVNTAWTLWLEQVHRIENVPQPTPVPAARPVTTAAALPTSDQGPLSVSLDGVPVGTAVWTTAGYALPVDEAAPALGLLPERTGAASLNLQGPSLVDNGTAPPVIAAPQTLTLSPGSVFGVTYSPIAGESASNNALENADPSIVYDLADMGRMASYSVDYETGAHAAATTGAPREIYLGLVEFTTSAGALQAVATEAVGLRRIQTGAEYLGVGDLGGAGGPDVVAAVTAKTFGKKVTTRTDWFLLQVDNWEVVVGVADPNGYFTPRTIWPYLAAVVDHIDLDGHALP